MVELPGVLLPNYFITLLRANMNGTLGTAENFQQYVLQNPPLHAIFQQTFASVDSKIRLDVIYRNCGWIGIRNRLASVFLFRQRHGYFDGHHHLALLNEILAAEEDLAGQIVDGYSSLFLFYFYLENIQILHPHAMNGEWKAFFGDRGELKKYLRLVRVKNPQIDWVLLQLGNFHYFLGPELLLNFLQKDTKYLQLYSALTQEQQEHCLKNFLAYGYSTQDEIFINNQI